MRTVVWSLGARAELVAIARFIARENPSTATAVSAKNATDSIRARRNSDRPTGRVSGTYEKSLAGLPYILAYEIVGQPDGNETVAILHVIHTAREWPNETWPQG